MPTEVALPFAAPDKGTLRRLAPAAIVLVAAAVFVLAARGPAHALIGALHRAVNADPRWVVAAIGFEGASFAGYIALFWHVAGRESERIGLRTSYEVTLAGAAATRLLPTAGAGGAVLTFWTLRRAGGQPGGAARTLLAFLVLLYSVFLLSVLVAGGLLATGAVGSSAPVELSAIPALAAGGGIALALAFAWRHRRAAPGSPVDRGRLRGGGRLLGRGVGDAVGLVRRGDARLLGAPAWWAFDMAVLWATFKAFGAAPSPAVLVLGYFLGQVANTVPIPGAVSGGMVGVFLAFGMPAGVVLPAVLAYRAVAIWTPVPAGAAALAGLRKRVARWASEDGVEADAAPVHVAARRSTRVGSQSRCGAPLRHSSSLSSRSRWPFQLRGPPPRTSSPIPAPS